MIRVSLLLLAPALEAGIRALLEADADIRVVDNAIGAQGSQEIGTADVHIMTSAAFARWTGSGDEDRTDAAIILLGPSSQDLQRLWSFSVPWGVLPLDVSSEELRAAIQATAAGLVAGPRPLLALGNEPGAARGPLSERQVEILGMLLQGLANKQIAVELGISEHTVKFHVSSIYTKLNVSNRTEAVREGLRNGWIAL